MPYILPEERHLFEDGIQSVVAHIECAGDLNFIFTRIVHEYLNRRGHNYANMNEVIGAIECMKLELYARVIRVYEDTKIASNGDVHPNV